MLGTFFQDKRVMVTGACGTVGQELVKQLLLTYDVGELLGIDNNESALFAIDDAYGHHRNTRFTLCDVRDRIRLTLLAEDCDVIFHTAAFKHVYLCERAPSEAVNTNILGVQNVISAANRNRVGIVIFTSSDKAANPTSVMGTSKLMGERVMTAANSNSRSGSTVFASTRFGNVIGSRGSVLPLFKNQIKTGGPVTLTHRNMTRFVMSVEESVSLVIDSATMACGGEVFVTKMPVIRIADLAMVMIEELAPKYGHNPAHIEVKEIGVKPGEKMYEELMTSEETRRAIELKRYFSIMPAFSSLYRDIKYDYPNVINKSVSSPLNSASQDPISRQQLKNWLTKNKLLD